MGDMNTNEDADLNRPGLWSWFIEECMDDLERRRGVYSFGETIKCRGIYGRNLFKKKKRKYDSFAGICLFLPHPLPECVGPLDHYVSKVRSLLFENKGIPEGTWLGFEAGPFPLPFHPWTYTPNLPEYFLEERSYDLRERIQDMNERIERPNRHYERRLQNYFSGSGIEPALTLAIASYLSHFCLPKLNVFHLYTAVLFSEELLSKFENKFSKINKEIKDDIENNLKIIIERKEMSSQPHSFESQALELIQSKDIEEIFLYVYQYGNYTDLRCFIDEELETGPHFFFKFIWKGVPFNKLFLGFLKLKPTDRLSFASDILLSKDPSYPVATRYISGLHLYGVPSFKRPEFFKEHWPIRRGCRFDNPLVGGKVLRFKSSLAVPNRYLNWEEEILLTCCIPKNLKLKLMQGWKEHLESEEINLTKNEDETVSKHIPNEGMQLWKNFNPNIRKKTDGSIEETFDTTNNVALNDISSNDLFRCTSYPLDASSKLKLSTLLFPIDLMEMSDIHDDIGVKRNIDDLIVAITKSKDADKLGNVSEVYTKDIFEDREDLLEDQTQYLLLDWTEEQLLAAEDIRLEMLTWNPQWKLKPFSDLSTGEISSILDLEGNSDQEVPKRIDIRPIINKKEKFSPSKKRYNEPPYWLQTVWKKIMWINWRGKNRLWVVDTLKKIEYLLLRNKMFRNVSLVYRKFIHEEQRQPSDLDIEISSESSTISENTSSSAVLTLGNVSSILDPSASEPLRESLVCSSSFSSVSERDCKYIQAAFRDQGQCVFPSNPPLSLYLSRSVAFFEMCSSVLRQKEEILQHALEKGALSEVPPKLHLSRQIQRFVHLFINYETIIYNRLSGPPPTSIMSVVPRKSRSRGADVFRTSTGKSFISGSYYDLGHWLYNFEEQLSLSEIQSRIRLQGYVRSLDSFKKLVVAKFLNEVSLLGEIIDSFRWKLSVKRPIRSQGAFLNFCCRIGPIRNATFLCDLLLRSESLKALIFIKIEELMHRRSRKTRQQTSIRTTLSSFVSSVETSSESSSIIKTVLIRDEDIIKKWQKKKEWPLKEEDEENLQIHWLDKILLDAWESSYSPQKMARRIKIFLGLRLLKKKIPPAHNGARKHHSQR